jgi:hypothetical protein
LETLVACFDASAPDPRGTSAVTRAMARTALIFISLLLESPLRQAYIRQRRAAG